MRFLTFDLLFLTFDEIVVLIVVVFIFIESNTYRSLHLVGKVEKLLPIFPVVPPKPLRNRKSVGKYVHTLLLTYILFIKRIYICICKPSSKKSLLDPNDH